MSKQDYYAPSNDAPNKNQQPPPSYGQQGYSNDFNQGPPQQNYQGYAPPPSQYNNQGQHQGGYQQHQGHQNNGRGCQCDGWGPGSNCWNWLYGFVNLAICIEFLAGAISLCA